MVLLYNIYMKSGVISNYNELKERLGFFADDEYREFVMKFCPSERPFLGVRVPQIREITNAVPKEKIDEFLKVEPVGYEEVLARGFLVARLDYPEMMKRFNSQVKYIDDWSTCDTFCSAVGKKVRKNRTEFFEKKIDRLLVSKGEFAVRTGLVLLKCSYVDLEWLSVIFDRVENLAERREYYIRMAIAWLVAECFIKFPTATTGYLVSSGLPAWTFNKIISKACDSYRVDAETKELLKKMRK